MKVWVDCTRAAHPLVLRPIIERLEAQGHDVFVTARDYGQTLGVLDRLGIPYTPSAATAAPRRLARRRPRASRSAGAVASDAAGPTSPSPTARSTWRWSPARSASPRRRCRTTSSPACSARSPSGSRRRVLVPDSIPVERMRRIGAARASSFRYPGLKEEYYLSDFEPDAEVLRRAGHSTRDGHRRAVRPPPETSSTTATIRSSEGARPARPREGVHAIVLPRTEAQRAYRALARCLVIVPARAIDAQSLIALADLVVSAGGTMNREAVALGTPVYTTFAGRMGGVDEALIAPRRLRVLETRARWSWGSAGRRPHRRGEIPLRSSGPFWERSGPNHCAAEPHQNTPSTGTPS